MMRKIAEIDHATVNRMDMDPGAGGAAHKYRILLDGKKAGGTGDLTVPINFQNGSLLQETGVNGVTEGALIACVIDRLEQFQAGPLPCMENEQALAHLRNALKALLARTERRKKAGIEGMPAEEGTKPKPAPEPVVVLPCPFEEGDTLTGDTSDGKTVTGKCVKITAEFVVLDVPGAPDLRIAKKNVRKAKE